MTERRNVLEEIATGGGSDWWWVLSHPHVIIGDYPIYPVNMISSIISFEEDCWALQLHRYIFTHLEEVVIGPSCDIHMSYVTYVHVTEVIYISYIWSTGINCYIIGRSICHETKSSSLSIVKCPRSLPWAVHSSNSQYPCKIFAIYKVTKISNFAYSFLWSKREEGKLK